MNGNHSGSTRRTYLVGRGRKENVPISIPDIVIHRV
jgi:hypothetical protein